MFIEFIRPQVKVFLLQAGHNGMHKKIDAVSMRFPCGS